LDDKPVAVVRLWNATAYWHEKQKTKTDSTYSAEPVLVLNHYCHGRPPSFGIKNHSIISLLPSLREDYLTLSFISFLLYRV
jgi:hypothetical protein